MLIAHVLKITNNVNQLMINQIRAEIVTFQVLKTAEICGSHE